MNWIKGQFQSIIFTVPFALDGNLRNSKELVALFYKKLKFTIENTIGERVNYSKYKVSIFCIWDKPKQKNHFKFNYELLVESKPRFNFYKCVFNDGIEKGLFGKFFSKEQLSLQEITRKVGYQNPRFFKEDSNKHLFFTIIQRALIENFSQLKRKLEDNEENQFMQILNLIDIH